MWLLRKCIDHFKALDGTYVTFSISVRGCTVTSYGAENINNISNLLSPMYTNHYQAADFFGHLSPIHTFYHLLQDQGVSTHGGGNLWGTRVYLEWPCVLDRDDTDWSLD